MKIALLFLFCRTVTGRRLLQMLHNFICVWPSSREQMTAFCDQLPHLLVHSPCNRLFIFRPSWHNAFRDLCCQGELVADIVEGNSSREQLNDHSPHCKNIGCRSSLSLLLGFGLYQLRSLPSTTSGRMSGCRVIAGAFFNHCLR